MNQTEQTSSWEKSADLVLAQDALVPIYRSFWAIPGPRGDVGNGVRSFD